MYKMLKICAFLLLGACTTDPVAEEEFEGPTGDFPLLGTVPGRDTLPPPSEDIKRQKKRLQREHDQATQKQAEILKSTKP